MGLAFLKTILRFASVSYQTEIRNYPWTLGLVTNFSSHLHLVVQMLQSVFPIYQPFLRYYYEGYSLAIPSMFSPWFSVYYIHKLKHAESTKLTQSFVLTIAAEWKHNQNRNTPTMRLPVTLVCSTLKSFCCHE